MAKKHIIYLDMGFDGVREEIDYFEADDLESVFDYIRDRVIPNLREDGVHEGKITIGDSDDSIDIERAG